MKIKNKIISLIVILLCIGWISVFSQSFTGEKIVPDISTEVIYDEAKVIFHLVMDINYHITDVKHGFFNITLQENDYFSITQTKFPKGIPYDEELVYKGKFQIMVFLEQLKKLDKNISLKFKVGFQICQEKPLEMCFAPDSELVNVEFNKDIAEGETTSENQRENKDKVGIIQGIENAFNKQLAKGSMLVFLFAFIAGFITSLTPCVYPVIPIVMGYVGSKSKDSKLRGFYLSLVFSLGLSLVYSILGVIAASTGSIIGASFQNPIMVIVIAAIFIMMGLSLAGLFEIPVPASLSSKIQAAGKGGAFGALVLGGVSAIIAAPCVGPVLIAILSMVSQTGNLFYGFLLTFVFSMGLSVLFIMVGTFSGVLSSLPRGGKWMTYIKYMFSILLILGGIIIISKVVPQWMNLLLWALFLMGLAVMGGVFSFRKDEEIKEKFYRLILVVILIMGCILFVKAINQGVFTDSPITLKLDEKKSPLAWTYDLDEALSIGQAENKIIMVDTYTDWCTACKKLEKKTFLNPEVVTKLNKLILVKIDFTKKNEKNLKVRDKYQILGFPTILFLDGAGNVLERFSTYLEKKRFLNLLNGVTKGKPTN